ncbi:hypothetical protein [Rubripirellula reticaptiva]|uniref:hypothetical protein n=1 Tax=Rubripirellula reticaptiva TaxID=2528013 RepID=UPI0016461D2F|nr:hypothetical protein [Rubripirellula reticaptiva]
MLTRNLLFELFVAALAGTELDPHDGRNHYCASRADSIRPNQATRESLSPNRLVATAN